MLKINAVSIKVPSKFQVDINDMDGESNYNAKGELVRDRLGVKRSLDCEWQSLTQAECSALLTAIKDTFFTVTFPDPMDGVITKTCYVGARTMPMYSNINNVPMWEGLKLQFTER